jgi:cobyrinic acid a,c-diamide synthase
MTLALADDEAFNFYYPDNLALLRNAGVKIVRFSPLHDASCPSAR